MTSQINPNNIDGAYPVAGQDNNSQGFRDNFTNTATNFQYAAAEITDLQSKAVLKAPLTGTTLTNDMLGSPLSNALLSDMALAYVNLGTLDGTVPINYVTAQVYAVTARAGDSISLAFTNWPDAGNYGWVQVQITITDVTSTVQFPVAVTGNDTGIVGYNTSTNVLSVAVPGTYTFNFSTVNGGTNITVNETNKSLQPFNNSSEVYSGGAGTPASLAVTSTLFPTGGTNQAALADGVNGQIKVLIQSGSTAATIVVASPGWSGSNGQVELTAQGESATLQYLNGAWYCIGGNGYLLT